MTPPRILIAGIGNIFLGDDAFGSEVARKLSFRSHPDGVRVVDFGIRGLSLAYALLDGYDAAILIDALPRRTDPPGTLYVLEPHLDSPSSTAPAPLIDGHSMDPFRVLRSVADMGSLPGRVLIVGCEPNPLDPDNLPLTMTPPVQAAVDPAIELVESLIQQMTTRGNAYSLKEIDHASHAL